MPEEQNSVSVAFEIMLTELSIEIEHLNSMGASLFRDSNYEDARGLTDRGASLAKFVEEMKKMSDYWDQEFEDIYPKEADQTVEALARTITSGTKAPKTGLLVKFADGTTIFEQSAASTFANAIQHFGFEKVRALDIPVNRENVVSLEKSRKYNDVKIAGYYVKTHSSTEAKKRQLLEIAAKIGVSVTIEIVG